MCFLYEPLVTRGASRKVTGIAVLVDLVYLTTTTTTTTTTKILKGFPLFKHQLPNVPKI